MRIREFFTSVSVLAVSLSVLLFEGCSKRSGPATVADLQVITNLVQSVTTNRILRVQQVDAQDGRLIVFTGSDSGQEHYYTLERSRSGWKIHSSGVK